MNWKSEAKIQKEPKTGDTVRLVFHIGRINKALKAKTMPERRM